MSFLGACFHITFAIGSQLPLNLEYSHRLTRIADPNATTQCAWKRDVMETVTLVLDVQKDLQGCWVEWSGAPLCLCRVLHNLYRPHSLLESTLIQAGVHSGRSPAEDQ